MNYSKLREAWRKEENIIFEGWNFSYLENRWITEKLPWNYRGILKKYLNPNYWIWGLVVVNFYYP